MDDFLQKLRAGLTTANLDQWLAWAQLFAQYCPEECVLGLYGDLGSGKTAFVKGLGKAWGIQTVRSPSFNIVDFHIGQRRLAHMDAYRLQNTNLSSFGLDDFLIKPYCLAIEWPEILHNTIPLNFKLHFSVSNNHHHVQLLGR